MFLVTRWESKAFTKEMKTKTLHFYRVSLTELEALPEVWLHHMHICDVGEAIPEKDDGMKEIAREGRLYPGEGCINFDAILKRIPNIPFAIELPNAFEFVSQRTRQ
jgi:sugar phosphate isomerase/epimerase